MSNTTYRTTSNTRKRIVASVDDVDEQMDDVDYVDDVDDVSDMDDVREESTGLFSTPARTVTLLASVGMAVVLLAVVVWLATSRGSTNLDPTKTGVGPGVEVSTITKANLGGENERPSNSFNVPDFEWADVLTGKPMRLSSFKGSKGVFINFWGTWCPPCRAEMPEMQRLYNQYKGQFEFVGVSMGDRGDTPEKVKSFVNDQGYTWRFVHDSDRSVANRFQISAVPSSYFVGTDGVVKAVHIGGMNGAQMEAYLQQAK